MGFSLKKAFEKVAPAIPFVGPTMLGMAGDYMAMEEARDENAKNRQHQDQINIANQAMQKEFAQMGIRWRVEDAKAAGLHPLAALGATGASASPSFQFTADQPTKSEFFSKMGQNLSRAVSAVETREERLLRTLQIERLGLENESLRIDNLKKSQVGPVLPSMDPNSGLAVPGQADSGIGGSSGVNLPVTFVPTGRTYSSKGDPSKAFGTITDWYYRRTPTGLKVAPSPDVQGVLANNLVEMLKWEIGHLITTMSDPDKYRPSYDENPLPPNKYWKFNRWRNEWQPADVPDSVIKKYGNRAQRYYK